MSRRDPTTRPGVRSDRPFEPVPPTVPEPVAVDRRRLLLGALGLAGFGAVGCTSRRSSTPVDAGSRSADTRPPVAGDGTAPRSAATAATPAATPAAGAEAIDGAATVDRTAERVAPPTPPGAYDRDARYVGLYGFPGDPVLGSLGEQGVDAAVGRVRDVAAAYDGFGRRVVPTFEIIATVASSSAGGDGDYSNEFDPARFEPWLDAARDHDLHIVFDLQPGRSRFPDQAREHEALWRIPNVSIALDPEWRVGPGERPGGGFIGTVDATEVNETIDYVDDVVRRFRLPPKMCVLHQFTPSMITNKQLIRGTEHVQVVLQMDGFGTLERKRGSWSRMVADLPPGALTGWKNFYDEDRPTPTPAETMANEPQPSYVSYQ